MTENAKVVDKGMGCVFRAGGDEFEVDELVTQLTLRPYRVYRKGQPRSETSSRLAARTGLAVNVSDASELNLTAQIEDAVIFLERNAADLTTIVSFPGVTDAVMDFSVACRIGTKSVAQFDYFPPKLLLRAGQLGVGICLSNYLARE